MRFLRACLVLGLCVSTTGANGSLCSDDSSSNTIVSADSSPSNLDVEATVEDKESPKDGKIEVRMAFKLDRKSLIFGEGETATCNGVALSLGAGSAYTGWVPQVSAGGSYNFVYTQKGIPTTLSLTAAKRPQFTFPMAGTLVQRCSSMTITYVTGDGDSMRGDAGDSATWTSGSTQKDSGSYTGLDVTKLKAGPGSIGLTRTVAGTPLRTGFKSAQTAYSVSSSIGITWF